MPKLWVKLTKFPLTSHFLGYSRSAGRTKNISKNISALKINVGVYRRFQRQQHKRYVAPT